MKTPQAKQLPSGSWRVQFRFEGKVHSVTRDSPTQAVAEAMAIKAGMMQAQTQKPNLTLSEAIDQYIEERSNVLSPSTIRGYRYIQKGRFQALMQTKLKSIDRETFQRAINIESAICAPKTLANASGFVQSVLADHEIEFKRIRLPQPIKADRPFLDSEQILELIDSVVGSDIEIPVLLAVWLGMRRSEILGLRWDAIDFKNATISVVSTLVSNEHNEMVERNNTKTKNSRRKLSCPQYILSKLEQLQPNLEKRTGRIIKINPDVLRNKINAICEKRGLPLVGIHGLRHTNASVMLALGIADKVAMERGGWSTEQTMKKIYQHVMSDSRKNADNAINSYFLDLITNKQGPK